jgi:hypothetical protein
MFIPYDLDYFIRFEAKDYDERCQLALQGIKPLRKCLTRDMYWDNQAAQGLVSLDSLGVFING